MELLNSQKRRELIDLLLSLPNIADPASRNLLLVDLPSAVQGMISNAGAPAIHIAGIVDALNDDARTQADGTVPLRTVIENAIYLVRGSRLAVQLQAMLDMLTIQTANTPSTSNPISEASTTPMLSLDNLTGPQRKQLYTALLDAFPTLAALRLMVDFGLNVNLDQITIGSSLDERAFSLVKWAEAYNRTEELVRAAIVENPGNTTLQAFAKAAGLIS